jgi:Arc/MetJ family transcription regulator
LTDADAADNFVCMRTTLNIDEKLIEEAQRATGVREKTAVIEMGLRKLVEEAARLRLAALAGRIPHARAPRRRRAARSRA